MADFDVIVVGAGIAGSTAAYKLASEGREALLIDRASEPGSKNLSGGIFYGRTLPDLIPGFYENAPIERKIVRNVVMFTRGEDALSIDYANYGFAGTDSRPPNGFSVLRAKFDSWLAEQAEEVGASVVPGICVESLIVEDGVCKGIVAGGEEMSADCVVVADGINSKLAEFLGQRQGFDIHDMGVGVKYLYKLDEPIINDRFHCKSGEGVAYGIMGDVSDKIPGGGFLYTNRDSISVGLVVHIDHLAEAGKTPYDVLDHMVSNPAVAELLKGAELAEYGAHMVAEGGKRNLSEHLSGNGWLIAGDAAGFAANNGFTVRGMDFAAQSGLLAAEAILQAKGDYSEVSLSKYRQLVEESFVGKDMDAYAQAPRFMKDERVYDELTEMVCSLFEGLYTQDGTPKKNMLPLLTEAMKASGLGLMQLGGIGMKAVRSL